MKQRSIWIVALSGIFAIWGKLWNYRYGLIYWNQYCILFKCFLILSVHLKMKEGMDSAQVRQLKTTGLFVWEQVNRLAGSWSLMSFVSAPRQHFLCLFSCPRHSCDVKGLKATSMICLALPWVYGNGLKCCMSFTPLSPWGTSTSGGE